MYYLGPMGATIAYPDQAYWHPISPYRWIDRNGDIWHAQPGQSGTSVMRELREQPSIDVWYKASQHHCGSGLGMRADLSVLSRHIAWYKKKDRHREATLLTIIAAGGIWPRVRIAEGKAGMDTTCPHCNNEPQTLLHLFWECSA